MERNALLLLYVSSLGLALFMMGAVDGLFFQAASYSKTVFGFPLGREDLYYASLTICFALICAACAIAAKIGEKCKLDTARFLLFTTANLIFFSIWLWALGWMQISATMQTGVNKPLDLWRFGPLAIYVNTADFPAIIAISFLLHAAAVYAAIKKNFLKAAPN